MTSPVVVEYLLDLYSLEAHCVSLASDESRLQDQPQCGVCLWVFLLFPRAFCWWLMWALLVKLMFYSAQDASSFHLAHTHEIQDLLCAKLSIVYFCNLVSEGRWLNQLWTESGFWKLIRRVSPPSLLCPISVSVLCLFIFYVVGGAGNVWNFARRTRKKERKWAKTSALGPVNTL